LRFRAGGLACRYAREVEARVWGGILSELFLRKRGVFSDFLLFLDKICKNTNKGMIYFENAIADDYQMVNPLDKWCIMI
jgi:hypothetical protein